MDADLQAFEDARSDRAKRTDYEGHKTHIVNGPRGDYEVAHPDSKHRERTRHEGTAADLARAYVAAHPELDRSLSGLTLDEIVLLVDLARANGNEERRIQLDAYLMAAYAPQSINAVHTGTAADR